MKHLYIIILCFISLTGMAQKMPDYGLYKVRITLADKTIIAEINPVSSNLSAKSNRFYYWYDAGAIHTTQGGFSGKLLDGQYNEYYLSKNLKEQGRFKKGLKDGLWKNWDAQGSLIATSSWKKGLQMSDKKNPLWKRLHLFRRKRKNPATDSLKKFGQ